jgi:hypothetical protein
LSRQSAAALLPRNIIFILLVLILLKTILDLTNLFALICNWESEFKVETVRKELEYVPTLERSGAERTFMVLTPLSVGGQSSAKRRTETRKLGQA